MLINISKDGINAQIDSQGAYINKLTFDDQDVIFPKSQIQVEGNIKTRGGSHPCFPYFGVAKKVGLNNHGFAREEEWSLVEQDESSVELSLVSVYEKWAFLNAKLTFEICDDSFITKLIVENKSDNPVKLSPGFHPYFAYSEFDTIKINGQYLNFSKEDLENSVFYENVTSLEIDQLVIKFENERLNKYVLWTDFVGKYLCVEPTNNWDALNKDGQLVELSAGESIEFSFEIKIERR